MTGAGRDGERLLLGEWACLGVLYEAPAHGFAVARRLAADGELGRVWSLSRPLTYRALDRLVERGYARAIGLEPGDGGPDRTVLAATRLGRARLRTWVRTPVGHVRDLRTELLVKLVVARRCGISVDQMLREQRVLVEELTGVIAADDAAGTTPDVVLRWRREMSAAALRFLDGLIDGGEGAAAPTGG